MLMQSIACVQAPTANSVVDVTGTMVAYPGKRGAILADLFPASPLNVLVRNAFVVLLLCASPQLPGMKCL